MTNTISVNKTDIEIFLHTHLEVSHSGRRDRRTAVEVQFFDVRAAVSQSKNATICDLMNAWENADP